MPHRDSGPRLNEASILRPSVNYNLDIIVRGILIVCIVLGHNRILSSQLPWLFEFLYRWHVHGFFFLALSARGLPGRSIEPIDILARFLIPFAAFLSAASVLASIRNVFSLEYYIAAIFIGSARLVNSACDMSLFWFLPAFCGFLLTISLIGNIAKRTAYARVFLIVISVFASIVSYILPRDVALYIPLGIPIAVYILPSAIMFCIINTLIEELSFKRRCLAALFLLIIFILGNICIRETQVDISLFKYGQGGGWQSYILEVVTSISAVLLIKAIVLIYTKSWTKIFQVLGRASLVIFLIHSFVQAPLVALAARLLRAQPFILLVTSAIAISIVAIAVSLFADQWLNARPKLRALILPYSWKDFIQAATFAMHNPLALLKKTHGQ